MSKKDKRKKDEFKLEDLKTTSDGKYIYPLKTPRQFGDDKITELHLDEPVAKHMRDMPSEPTGDDMLKIFADLSSQPDSFIDMLSIRDVNALNEFFEAFA